MNRAGWCRAFWAPFAAVTIGCAPAPPPEPTTAARPPDRPSTTVPSHRTVRPAPPFRYESAGLRDPFQAPVSEWERGDDRGRSPAPDLQRRRTVLEGFSMQELRMVGVLAGSGARSALVGDPDGMVHAVRVGDYVGRDFGRVEAIGDAGLVLIEAIADGSGGWVTRHGAMRLSRPAPGPSHPVMEPRGDA